MAPMTSLRTLLGITLAVAALAACSSKPKPVDDTLPENRGGDTAPDTRTELERRRDAACETLAPRMTSCAIEDARRTMTPEELAKLDIESTAPIHTREFVKSCKAQTLSSRQVRVYEVCLREETACDPMIACLDNANPTAP
jgi:hypothetical protein